MIEADYVIVGAGSAGCVLAARLSEDADVSVILLEAGGSDDRPWMAMPLGWRDSFKAKAVEWGYMSEPEAFANGRSVRAIRGRVMGGTSSINGMLYARGFQQDYAQWQAEGARGWSFDDVLPYFRKMEASWRGEGAYHGMDGPLRVSRHSPQSELYEALAASARDEGIPSPQDIYAVASDNFGVPDFTIGAGRRASTATAYLADAKRRPNIHIIKNASATSIRFAGRQAVGVSYRRGGATECVSARMEVILAAGAFNSPHLLMLSGIGDARKLQALGIETVCDLPGVGQNLQDHHAINLTYGLEDRLAFERRLRVDRMALSVLQWKLLGRGVAATVPVAGQLFRRIDGSGDWPDMQMVITPVSMDARLWFPGWRRGAGPKLATSNVLLRPVSTGSVELRSKDALEAPRIRFNLLKEPEDRDKFRAMFRFTQRYFSSPRMADCLTSMISPERLIDYDAEIDAIVRETVGTAMHPAGTCAMGDGAMAVLDARCRVRGIGALRVVDASAMPHVVSGNTNAPVIMMAEKMSDILKRDRQ